MAGDGMTWAVPKPSEAVREAAERALDKCAKLRDEAERTHREWKHSMTLTNAMYRDRARFRLEEFADVETVARFVLGRHRPEGE